jgi:hypothetical protein
MGLIASVFLAIGGVLMAVLVATLSRLIADDLKEWMPWATQRLIDVAVRRLPEDQRERFTAEWQGAVSEIPGPLSRLLWAADLIRAGLVITRDQRKQARAIQFAIMQLTWRRHLVHWWLRHELRKTLAGRYHTEIREGLIILREYLLGYQEGVEMVISLSGKPDMDVRIIRKATSDILQVGRKRIREIDWAYKYIHTERL